MKSSYCHLLLFSFGVATNGLNITGALKVYRESILAPDLTTLNEPTGGVGECDKPPAFLQSDDTISPQNVGDRIKDFSLAQIASYYFNTIRNTSLFEYHNERAGFSLWVLLGYLFNLKNFNGLSALITTDGNELICHKVRHELLEPRLFSKPTARRKYAELIRQARKLMFDRPFRFNFNIGDNCDTTSNGNLIKFEYRLSKSNFAKGYINGITIEQIVNGDKVQSDGVLLAAPHNLEANRYMLAMSTTNRKQAENCHMSYMFVTNGQFYTQSIADYLRQYGNYKGENAADIINQCIDTVRQCS